MVTLLCALTALIWTYLFTVHGRPLIGWKTARRGHPFWRQGPALSAGEMTGPWPSVAIIVPARDEVATIWPVVRAHLATHYPGPWHLTVVDDHSSDGTADLARAAAGDNPNFSLTSPPALPTGWSGKLWALNHAIEQATAMATPPDYILLTDADILHQPETLQRLVTYAVTQATAMTSLMARLDARGFWGGLLMPAFVYFFMKLYPFARVNAPGDRLAGAAGGCVLVRTARLKAVGGVAAIRNALIDDCALAERLKNHVPRAPIFLALARDEITSLRDNHSLASIWQMVSRTAYTQLQHNPTLLLLTLIGMALVYLLPAMVIITAIAGWPVPAPVILFALISFALMSISFLPVLQLYKKPWALTLTLPMAAVFYTLMTLHSAIQHWRGRGGAWKGRTYSLTRDERSSVP
ncbi:MAG: glycosyltransferase [Pseudomonadota bacterium]